MTRRVLLLVLDGCGWRAEARGNAVTAATLPTLFARIGVGGVAVLEASGEAVGLEAGQVGNSEAGHLTIGAGCVVPAMTRRLLEAHQNGSWARDPAWERMRVAGIVHLVGLVSDAGVHGLARTLAHAARTAAAAGVREIVVHPVLDGVDSLAGSAPRLLNELERDLAGIPGLRYGVIQGRKNFCDRSGSLDPARAAVAALGAQLSLPEYSPEALALHLRSQGEASFAPHLFTGGRALRPGEPVLHTSHRADRARAVATVLAERNPLTTLVEMGKGVDVEHVFFPTRPLTRGLPFELKQAGLSSLRVAEKCKFPHVTFFLNGFDAATEGRGVCLDSIQESEIPKRPEMSAAAVTERILAALANPEERVVIANLANLDQVGHLGDVALAERAAAEVDRCYSELAAAAAAHGWSLFVTSDHGNADTLIGEDGRPYGSHSSSPVPFVCTPAPGLRMSWSSRQGSLANVAATVLAALGLTAPEWMAPSLLAFE